MHLPGSGNYLVDMYEAEMTRQERYPEGHCSDCDSAPCRCDDLYEQFKERTEHGE